MNKSEKKSNKKVGKQTILNGCFPTLNSSFYTLVIFIRKWERNFSPYRLRFR